MRQTAFWHWFAGFVDGEGCFCIRTSKRKGGYTEIQPSFSICLREDDIEILREIKERLDAPNTRIKRHPAHTNKQGVKSNPKAFLEVRSFPGCRKLIVILDRHTLRAKKARDYAKWREIIEEMSTRTRGNKWHGRADNTKILAMIQELKDGRKYR